VQNVPDMLKMHQKVFGGLGELERSPGLLVAIRAVAYLEGKGGAGAAAPPQSTRIFSEFPLMLFFARRHAQCICQEIQTDELRSVDDNA